MWEMLFHGEYLALWTRKSSRGTAYIATSPDLKPSVIARGHHVAVEAVKTFIQWTEDPRITEYWHEYFAGTHKDYELRNQKTTV